MTTEHLAQNVPESRIVPLDMLDPAVIHDAQLTVCELLPDVTLAGEVLAALGIRRRFERA